MEYVKERVAEEHEEEGQRPSLTVQVSVETDSAGNGANDHSESESLNIGSEYLNRTYPNLKPKSFVSGKGANVDIMTASSSKISSAITSFPPFNKQQMKEKLGDDSFGSPRPVEGDRQEWELDLEKVYDKPDILEFYCPRCDVCIKKVIVRSKDYKRPPEPPCPGCSGALVLIVRRLFCCGSGDEPLEPVRDPGVDKWEILKSIVYGGLAESITSLSVVTSAASADAATLNIIALALANLVGGLFVLGQNLWELWKDQPGKTSDGENARVDRYQELLGEKKHFSLHVILAILSFLFFGLIPPVVYGFTFIKSDNRDYKLAAVAATSLLCVLILASGKALIQKPWKFQKYVTIVMQYVVIAVLASGVSYVAGDLFEQLLEKLGLFSSHIAATKPGPHESSGRPSWSSY